MTFDYPADGQITAGRGEGDYVHCFNDTYPVRLNYHKLVKKDLTILSNGWYASDGTYLWNGEKERDLYFLKNKISTFTPQTVARIELLASTSTGPSASSFVKGTLIGGVAVGAAAAMATIGSTHTVKVTWRDDNGGKESIIAFNDNDGFQKFIGKLGNLMNQPNEETPDLSFPTISVADEILKFKKLMDEGIISQAEFDAKKKQLLGIENADSNSSKTNVLEYYSVMLASCNDSKAEVAKTYWIYKSCSLTEAVEIVSNVPVEIIGTTSKSEAEQVAKKFALAGATVEIKQPKSNGGCVVKTFTLTDAPEGVNQTKDEEFIAKQNNLKEGDTFFFGSHNGQRISWKVLKIHDHKALIITENIVCKMPYHQLGGNVTWSDCTLRKWLNNDFFYGDFTETLRARILSSQLDNDDNMEYKAPGSASTTDEVFVLSINEARALFANNQARAGDFWWLRSSGENHSNAAYVFKWGEICTNGDYVRNTCGVRPAMWIDFLKE